MERDWSPFRLREADEPLQGPRAISTLEGVGDRLRAAAFAEIQAREAFLWAAGRFEDAPEGLRRAWRALAGQEDRHLGWLLARLEALGIGVADRPVSPRLWESFVACSSAREFALFMASAEERGRVAGERFHRELLARDRVTAEIFGTIAAEEAEHVALAKRYSFPIGTS